MTVIAACGDVGVNRAAPDSMLAHCGAVLRAADVSFGQLETTVSDRGAAVPNARLAMRAPPASLRSIKAAGFDVMSFAGNHCLDYGYQAFTDTLQHAAEAGIELCGAGESLGEARRARIIETGGIRVAFLAASSILPEGYAAEPSKAGCAPMRAHTIYEQIEHDQPGTPARVRSFPHRADLDALCQSIAAARPQAEAVLVSLHWGIHMIPSKLADYQVEVAHAVIEAGADAVIGHHPHLLKGIEFFRGKPIFYSLGNFAIEQPHVWDPAIVESASFRNLVSLNPSWNMDQVYMLPRETRLTGIAKLSRNGSGDWDIRFLPAWIGDDSAPQMLQAADPRFAEVVKFLIRSSDEAGLNCSAVVDGDEVLLEPR
jgi:poly-gamma-glutamate capsule biosynthesis protein CapA/YwtB (metallophosphatase superfamily)